MLYIKPHIYNIVDYDKTHSSVILKSLTLKAVLELDVCDTPNETYDIDKYIDIMTSFMKTQFVQFVLCMTYIS